VVAEPLVAVVVVMGSLCLVVYRQGPPVVVVAVVAEPLVVVVVVLMELQCPVWGQAARVQSWWEPRGPWRHLVPA
jgi:hypothetical protein